MARVDTFCCDVCGKQKKDVNRWYRAYLLIGGVGVMIIQWDTEVPAIVTSNRLDEIHLCGAECVSQWVSRTLL